jgi:serine/threonine protein kinase
VGEQLDLHLQALKPGGQRPTEKPGFESDLEELRPVVDKLHALSQFLETNSVADSTQDHREMKDSVDSPASPDMSSSVKRPAANEDAAGPGTPRIGKYQVVRKLGTGGQAGAYLAFDPDLHRHVVIKLYHEARTPHQQEMILQEGRALARVRSAYIAQCYSAERYEGLPYLVVEYVPGKNLAQVQRSRPLSLDQALELIRQIAEGLAAVHACGLLHRDLKPANILVGDNGIPRLVDFGLAAPLAGESLRGVSGTLAYMAPEQARGEVERIDPRSDVFGLGAVLYELLTGRPPYRAESAEGLWRAARAGDVVPPRTHQPTVPASVNDLCMRCLAKHPGQRFASAAELAQAIRRWQRRQRWRGLLSWRVLAGAAAALLVLASVAVWFSTRKVEPLPVPGQPSPVPPRDKRPVVKATPRDKSPAAKATPRHPNGRPLRQNFSIQVEVAGKTPDAQGRYHLAAGEKIRFRVRLPCNAYVGVWHYDDDGNVIQLFPNAQIDPTHRVQRREWQSIPSDEGYAFEATPSKRLEYIHVAACTRPWEPPANGLRGEGKDNSFLVVTEKQVETLVRGLKLIKVDQVAEAVLAFKVEGNQ